MGGDVGCGGFGGGGRLSFGLSVAPFEDSAWKELRQRTGVWLSSPAPGLGYDAIAGHIQQHVTCGGEGLTGGAYEIYTITSGRVLSC